MFGRPALVNALRAETGALRARLTSGDVEPGIDAPDAMNEFIERGVRARLEAGNAPSLLSVINGTGVVIHTNLGRAPLSHSAATAAATLASGYTNLEYDLDKGARGRRDVHAETLICRLTKAEAAVVVNNNAAAALLVLAALASGREVIISRGELVEIGGGFRVPDVMTQSGAILREVGTTNRTRVSDYAAAISERTAAILRVHPSNFTIEGFTERPELKELVAVARRFDVPVIEDLGSGLLEHVAESVLRDEPTVAESVTAGVSVVMFSGDKLLGGPQAGIIAGVESAISRIRQHPLMRALRVDKLTYAALEATLAEHAAGRASESVPVARMIALSSEAIGRRAHALAERLAAASIHADVIDGFSAIGGGSAPGRRLPTRLVAISLPASRFEAALRTQRPAVVARIEGGRVLIDLRTVPPEQDEQVATVIVAAASTLLP
jgi:L-seryl-tRNA(Ser) seleniumtransferase